MTDNDSDTGSFDKTAELLAEAFGPFAQRHHARYHRPDVPIHVIIRTFQGRSLLRPDAIFRTIATGILGHGLAIASFQAIKLFAFVALNNHLHLQLQGPPAAICGFISFVKRELTRRYGPLIGWGDSLWRRGYLSAALPTIESQLVSFEYILSHGVKECIVGRPEEWTGLHFGAQGLGKDVINGEWLNGTHFGKALWKEQQKPKDKRKHVDKATHTEPVELRLAVLPAWEHLSPAGRKRELATMLVRIVVKGESLRQGAPPLGMETALNMSREVQRPLPKAPWFEERRPFICWSDPFAPETQAYIEDYWNFQLAYRAASDAYLAGDVHAKFPPGAFKPVVATPFAAEPKPTAVSSG